MLGVIDLELVGGDLDRIGCFGCRQQWQRQQRGEQQPADHWITQALVKNGMRGTAVLGRLGIVTVDRLNVQYASLPS